MLWQDLQYGARMLLKQPGFTVVAVLTLALGIGANSALFSVVNAVLLRPLPYQHPERLFKVNRVDVKRPRLGARTSPLNFLDWRSQNQTFEYLGGYTDASAFNLSGGAEPERVAGAMVSDTLFPALGIKPILGRNFLPEEDRMGGNNAVILSHQLWTRRFGDDRNILGQTLTLDSRIYTIVGVMPRGFDFPSKETLLWVPYGFVYEDGGRGNFFVEVIGKIKAGITREQAQADMEAIAARLEQTYPETNADSSIALVPLHEQVTGKIRRTLLLLLGAVGFVLLIACANVANLLLSRAAARQKEMAIRSALGANRFRIVRQLLSESLLLSLLGGACGLLIAYGSVQLLVAISPEDIPRLAEVGIDGRILGFTFALALLTGLLFGLAPALQASKPDLNETLKEGGRSSSGGSSLLRSSLVVAEIALSLVLLIGAGLLARSFEHLLSVNPGFETERILTFDMTLPWAKYDRERSGQFFQQALERLQALPGAQSVGATTALPLSKDNNARYFTIEGRPGNSPRDYTISNHRQVSLSYFQTLGIRLLKGRHLSEQDFTGTAPVVIINQAFARAFFPGQDAIGKRLKMGETSDSPFPWMTVAGIVGDVKHTSLEADARPEIYRPFLRNRDAERKMTFAVRTTQNPAELVAAIRQQIQTLDRDQPIANVATMEQLFDQSVARRRFSLLLLGIFAVTALILASVGIYGVISYTVTQSTREIGIRMALGAEPRDVLKLVVGQGLVLTLIGVAAGAAGAFGLTRLMANLLFDVTPTDPLTFIIVSVLLAAVALFACYIPARRAAKVDPMVALRCE
jgi:putative ABC transport system permease protein